ncbi:MAG: hypothetical protein ABSB97_04330 [Thermoplasmata archaeon]|jgi:hypothetical protein
MPDTEPVSQEVGKADYVGWVAAALVILAICVVAAVFWFRYHP